MDPRERDCLRTGFFDHLIFDSDDHHRAAWASVREEMLRLGAPWPAALFTFELFPAYGPRLSEVREAQLPDGRYYHRRWTESDAEYFERHNIDIHRVVKHGV
jgi:hypothetical protein